MHSTRPKHRTTCTNWDLTSIRVKSISAEEEFCHDPLDSITSTSTASLSTSTTKSDARYVPSDDQAHLPGGIIKLQVKKNLHVPPVMCTAWFGVPRPQPGGPQQEEPKEPPQQTGCEPARLAVLEVTEQFAA
ncbi:MAG: hypothetical protein LW720_13170 [Pirellula sp.]|nr:hypothetical protein [Pirellula sp.]